LLGCPATISSPTSKVDLVPWKKADPSGRVRTTPPQHPVQAWPGWDVCYVDAADGLDVLPLADAVAWLTTSLTQPSEPPGIAPSPDPGAPVDLAVGRLPVRLLSFF
jgi:hypothetical protein